MHLVLMLRLRSLQNKIELQRQIDEVDDKTPEQIKAERIYKAKLLEEAKHKKEYQGLSEEQVIELEEAKTNLAMYEFRHSWLYKLCWQDLDDSEWYRPFFYIGQCIKRIIFAWAITTYPDNGVLVVQYLCLTNAAVIK